MTATFFGEVNELQSRAVWSSDSEEENDQNVEVKELPVEVTFNVEAKCHLVYVCVTANANVVAGLNRVGQLVVRGKSSVLANLYLLETDKLLMQINTSFETLKNHLVRRTIRMIFSEFFNKFPAQPCSLIIISKNIFQGDQSSVEPTCLKNQFFNDGQLEVKCGPLLAPAMIKCLIESSLFELATVQDTACCLIQIPDPTLYKLQCNFIPDSVISCVKSASFSSDSSYIYT